MITTKLTRMCWRSWLRLSEANVYKTMYEEQNKFIQEHMKKTCNVCAIQGSCGYAPDWGKPVRWNCPFFVSEAGDGA